MKNVLQKTFTTLALIVAMMTAAATVKAQQVNMSKYITLTVQSGQQIKLNFKAAAPNTPVRIVSGSNTQDITVGTSWYDGNTPSNFTVTSDGTTMTVYGNITGFDCFYNQDRLTAIDVSNNTELEYLECSSNQLTSLDVSGCTALTRLFCDQNQLTSLDVSGCTALTGLFCYENQLTSLDVSGCTALTRLFCYQNQFTSLDVSGCTALTELNCSQNQLTSLDVSGCTALTRLSCSSNQLTSLDVSGCTALTELYCSQNQLTSLDVSGCTALTELYCYYNSFSTAALDRLYCSLPSRTEASTGVIYLTDISFSDSQYPAILASSGKIATDKNWAVRSKLLDTDIPTTGNYDCLATSGIDNPLAAAALTLYPNPVESILHIEAEGEVRSIRIYNIYGTEVATATATKQIDLSHLPAGVYALRVETERGVATQRVVKK